VKSFEASTTSIRQRLFDAYAAEVARVDSNGDGVLSFEEADVEGMSDGLPNSRLYLGATKFQRFAVTRELNDGLLAPRFSPSQRAWVLSGPFARVNPRWRPRSRETETIGRSRSRRRRPVLLEGGASFFSGSGLES
jgi:hypothetical protein